MTKPLPIWIERLLGIHAEPGEGMAWSLNHTWGWPAWLTLLFAVFAVVFVVSTYLRENRRSPAWFRLGLAGIRLLLIAIVLVMLAQFALLLERTGLPYVAVLVDDSLSMSVVDQYPDELHSRVRRQIGAVGYEKPSRWNLARTLLIEDKAALLKGIQKEYKLRMYYLTGERSSQSAEIGKLLDELRALEPEGESSRLGQAIRAVLNDLRGSAPAAIVLLTDGINTDGPPLSEAAALARRKGVPLFAVALGDDRPVRDLKLADLLVDDVVFAGDVVNFEAKLSGTGYDGKQVQVVLRRLDKPDVLAKTTAVIDPVNPSQAVRLTHRPTEEGEFQYVVEVEPQAGELQTDNNRQQRTIRVRKEQIRVLLVYAYPSFEYRYLRNMLGRDSTIDLDTVLQEADLEHAEQDASALKSFPVRRDELFRYDVVILGDVNPSLLSDSMLQNLADFVDKSGKGGALVAIAGPQFMPLAYRDTPLAKLLPVELGSARIPEPDQSLTDGFVVRPTELGLASPPMQLGDSPGQTREIWDKLPPLYWMVEAADLKPAVRVLAEHPDRIGHDGRRLPVIVMQYVGAGKVLFHATDESWRWRYRVGDVFFARYWIQTIRYLARSKLTDADRSAALTLDRREYRHGESVSLRVRFADERMAPAADDGVTVVLEHEGHKTRRIKLQRSTISRGIFETRLENLAVGSYHAWVAIPTVQGQAPAADFTVVAPPGEFERIQPDTAELKRAAEATKGRFYTFATAKRLLKDLPEGRQVPIESLPPRPLWNRWPLLAAFLVLLIGEWILRKVGGMV
ncbi:MAG: VWA domain-containing protein [Pirellulales bacterium]|nr:VWA domain-containing protein [Pirellulales bacterium]